MPPTTTSRPALLLPLDERLLMHACCTACTDELMDASVEAGIDDTMSFHDPNLHPAHGYEPCKQENIRFAEQRGVPLIDAAADTDRWFARARGMEHEPGCGIRCTMYFDMRFERTRRVRMSMAVR